MRILLVLAMTLAVFLAAFAEAQTCADIQLYDPLTGAPNSPYDTQVVSVSGILYVADGVFGDETFYLMQGSSGIRFDLTTSPTLIEGSEIGIDGTVTTADGEIILTGATIAYNYGIPNVEPSVESVATVLEPFTRVGQFVAVAGVVCARTDSSFCLSDSGDTVQVWVDQSTSISLSAVADGDTCRVRAACSMFNGEIRLLPRRQTDLVKNPNFVRVQVGGDGYFATIAEGLDASTVGDTVLVSCGTYFEHDLALKGGVAIRGVSEDPSCVTIDAQQMGGVFDFIDVGLPEWFHLEGLTITGAGGPASALRIYIDAKKLRAGENPKVPIPMTVKNCVIRDNVTTGFEGIIYTLDLLPPLIFDNCVFANNSSAISMMKFESSLNSLRIVDCTLVGNSTPGKLVHYGDVGTPMVEVENSILALNQVGIFEAGDGNPPVFTCTNIYGNSEGDWLDDIAAQADTLGNFSADPHFCDLAGGDFSLAEGSLCLPDNHPSGDLCGLIGARGQGACGPVPAESASLQANVLGHEVLRPGDSVVIQLQVFDASDGTILNEGLAPQFLAPPTLGTVTPLVQQPDSTWTALYTAGLIEGAEEVIGSDVESATAPHDTVALHITNSAIITAVADIANDQGREVRVYWNADVRDTLGSADPIVQYVVWREVPAALKTTDRRVVDLAMAAAMWIDAKGRASNILVRAQQTLWEPVGPAVPGMMWTQYASTVATLSDSTNSLFFVSAHTPNPQVFFSSVPALGYSLDNLAPAAPTGVQAAYLGGETTISWAMAPELDFHHHRVYRGGSEDFVATADNLVMATGASQWPDPNGGPSVYYKVTTVDFAGNESSAGSPPYVSAIEDGTVPARNVLQGAAPNPFNPVTRIAFSLATPGAASLKIYDPAGRLVAVLFDEHREQGPQTVAWDGRDTEGRISAAGVYLYRLEAAGFAQSGRVTMVK